MAEKQMPKKNKLILSIVICAIILLVALSGSVIAQLSYNKVYNGVYLNNNSISGLTKDELISQIPEMFDKSLSKNITLSSGDVAITFESLSVSPVLDTEAMAKKAFSFGRSKNFLGRISEIAKLKKNPQNIDFMLDFDEIALQKKVDELSQNLEITAIDNKIEYGDNELVITRGKAGNGILFSEVKAQLEECILSDKSIISVELKHVEPEEITYEYIKRHTTEKAVSAEYKIENHRLTFTESQPGVKISKDDIKNLISKNSSDIIRIPAKITQPEVTSESLKSTILAHELGRFSSNFASSSNDRAYNIQLACEKINGYVLAPGEEFSYNNVVGPRTTERGFRIANVYVGNTVQPGVGGGICQVSSTMYNAVVFAGLEVTERRNHTLPVDYVPMGRDATVSYGTTDFKFKNTTSMPIEIKAIAEGRINTIIIMGTDEHPEREIKITTSNTGTYPPKVVKKDDPTLPEGEIKVESKGTNGSSYVAYKVVYENGEEISSTVLARSRYAGKDRVELVGTMKVELPPEVVEPVIPEEVPPVPEVSPTPEITPPAPEEIVTE